MSNHETSSRRSHYSLVMDQDDIPQCSQPPPPKKNRQPSKLCLGLMIGLFIIYSALIITGAVMLYANKDYIRVEVKRKFYKLSSGEFEAETEITGADVRQQIQSLMESHKPTTSKGIEKMRSMYRNCLDFNSYGEEAIQKAYQLIQEVGYFPMLQGDVPSHYKDFNWAKFMMKLAPKDLGLQLFGIYGTRDPKDKSRRMVELAESELSPYRGVWLNQSAHQKEVGAERTWLRETMETFAKDVGLVPNRQQIEEQIQELFDMHSRLAPFLMADEEKRNYADRIHPEKFGGLVERFMNKTGLDLREWMKAGNPQKAQDFLYQEDLVVNVQRPEFVDNVVSVIKSTPARTLLNYYQLSALSRYRGLFPERYRDISQRYNSVMSGSAEKVPRWKTCLAMANGLRPLMGAFYVRNFYGKETKAAVKEMADNLQEAFRGIVEEADWMDHDTKQMVLRKGNEMLVMIPHAEEAFDDAKLDAPYADLNLSDGQTMLQMVDEHRRWSNEHGWRKFLEPYKRGEFTALASEVNAYNNGDRNAITFKPETTEAARSHGKESGESWTVAELSVAAAIINLCEICVTLVITCLGLCPFRRKNKHEEEEERDLEGRMIEQYLRWILKQKVLPDEQKIRAYALKEETHVDFNEKVDRFLRILTALLENREKVEGLHFKKNKLLYQELRLKYNAQMPPAPMPSAPRRRKLRLATLPLLEFILLAKLCSRTAMST